MLSMVEAWDRLSRDPIYVVQGDLFGIHYLESPEEQGLSTGPMLLRVFGTHEEAERYRQAVIAYAGPGLVVHETDLNSIWGLYAWWTGVKIELCRMSESEWAKPLMTLRDPEAVAC